MTDSWNSTGSCLGLVSHRRGCRGLAQGLLVALAIVTGCAEEGGDEDKPDSGSPCSGVDDSTDGTDQDCDGVDGVDADGDGFADVASGGDDCDDSDAAVSPGATEVWYDGVDTDCDGADDFDADGDGHASDAHEGDDCDDTASDVYPGAEEDYSDEIDHDCDGEVDRAESTCSSELVLTTSEGDELAIDGCVEWDLSATFEFDPDDVPELRTFTLALDATDEPDFECAVTIEQERVCGEGYYIQDDSGPGRTVVTTLDCSGVDDADETTFTGTGWLLIDDIDTGSEAGSFAGQPLYTSMSATLSVSSGDLSLTGSVSVGAIQIAGDSEEETDCAVSDGDEDEDGQIDLYYGGTDCDDADPFTHLGAADVEDPSACMRDEDDDGHGADTVSDGVTPGTDCDDTDATAYTGAAAEEAALCTRDVDSDGYGDDNAAAPLQAGTDCDDSDATAYTGAAAEEPELCTWDADADGYGDMAAVAPLEAGTDCNDADPVEFPGAVTEATGGECMLDADSDGYGDKGATGLYDVGTDCNDADSAEFPGAVTEATGGECMRDSDGDGYGDKGATGLYDVGTDCNDADSAEFPGAVTEATGGECMLDSDGDGFGDEDAGGLYDPGTDCYDTNASVYPGAASEEPELCALDSDGDGWGHCGPYSADPGSDCNDADPSQYPGAITETAGTMLCMEDNDGDGWGTPSPTLACHDAGTDCDDGDPTGHPQAASAEPDLCTVDSDGDGFGDEDATTPLDAGTDCDDGDPTIYPDSSYLDVLDGIDQDCDGDDNTNSVQSLGLGDSYLATIGTGSEAGDYHTYVGGDLVTGDWDADGLPDVFVDTMRLNSNVMGWLVSGPVSTWSADLDDAATWSDTQLVGPDMMDVDGDGYDDLAALTYTGALMWYGPTTGGLDSSNAFFHGTATYAGGSHCYDSLGDQQMVSLGDANNDGFADLLIGKNDSAKADCASTYYWEPGSVRLFYGPLSGTTAIDDDSNPDWIEWGPSAYSGYGWKTRFVGDVDGDGFEDVGMGSQSSGTILLYTDLPSGGSSMSLVGALPSGVSGIGRDTVFPIGDHNTDGYPDLFVVSRGAGGVIVEGGATISATAAATFSHRSEYIFDVAGGGDFDGDGFEDLLINAWDGNIYLIQGITSGSVDLEDDAYIILEDWGGTPGGDPTSGAAIAGEAMTFADLDDDGFDDLLIGNVGKNTTVTSGLCSSQWPPDTTDCPTGELRVIPGGIYP